MFSTAIAGTAEDVVIGPPLLLMRKAKMKESTFAE